MSESATTPSDRRKLIVRAVMAHRRSGGDPVVFDDEETQVRYDDRLLELAVTPSDRDRLDELLAAYPVFKVKQPETRKAPDETVFISAIADPKHLADFIEDCFRELYGRDEDYRLSIR